MTVKIKDINLIPFTDEELATIREYIENRRKNILDILSRKDAFKTLSTNEIEALCAEDTQLSEIKCMFSHNTYVMAE